MKIGQLVKNLTYVAGTIPLGSLGVVTDIWNGVNPTWGTHETFIVRFSNGKTFPVNLEDLKTVRG
jgi:hypothetical protein